MNVGHAHFESEPLSVSASPPVVAPALGPLEPLSPLSGISPSPPLLTNDQSTRTRLASGSAGRPSQRRRDATENTASPPASTTSARRMRPLACMTSNTNANANAQNPSGKEKPWKADAWRVGGTQQHQQQAKAQQIIEFPPKHVVLHPDDANNKVFLAMGRGLMSINNCATTIKDLAELSMQHGLVCQNVSAASQAITFFIRSHLNRCEEEKDFPLLLRHVLSGTPRDDALAPALYSRTGGNVSNKDKTARDENGNLKERVTCFRRGTTVWYLSKAAGAPCPFARAGIALRDYAEGSAITNVEGRKGDNDLYRGIKRKRERNLRRRAGSGPAARRDSDDSDEERKPPKIKLTLRLRPCLTTAREKHDADAEESSSSSSSDSDSDAQDDPMDIDASASPTTVPPAESSKREPTWSFPPYPIQRRISIPPYTPSEEIYPLIYTSPTANFSSSTFFSEWSTSAKPLACIDSPPLPRARGSSSYFNHHRDASIFSVASPPPESEDDFDLSDDDDDVSVAETTGDNVKREDESVSLARSTSLPDLPRVKSELDDESSNKNTTFERIPAQTIKQENVEDLGVDFTTLNLSIGEAFADETDAYDLTVKYEDDGLVNLNEGFAWGHPVDLTQVDAVEPVCDGTSRTEVIDDAALQLLWKNVELLGPETVRLQDLEDGSWDEGRTSCETAAPSSSAEQHDEDVCAATSSSDVALGSPPGSPALSFSSLSSLSPPPSLAGSVHAWSALSPDTEIDSVGPASPPSFVSPGSPAILRGDVPTSPLLPSNYIQRSSPWMIPGKPSTSSGPSRQAIAVRSDDIPGIPLSEHSAPWEREMCTEEDVEKHLLEPPQALAMMSLRLPLPTDSSFENTPPAPEPPLSPQEEEIFQSLCICPDMSWDDGPSTDAVKQEPEKTPEVLAPRIPNTSLPSVFAAATRPTMRLRERRPSKRPTEVEQVRKQAQTPACEMPEESEDAIEDSDAETDGVTTITLRKRGKDVTVNNVDSYKGPLRRSKRVANVVAMQRNRERLRKRTVS